MEKICEYEFGEDTLSSVWRYEWIYVLFERRIYREYDSRVAWMFHPWKLFEWCEKLWKMIPSATPT